MSCPDCKIKGYSLTLCDFHIKNGFSFDLSPRQRPDCCARHKQIDLNNTRLLENNQLLQAKLRKGNRAILNKFLERLPEKIVIPLKCQREICESCAEMRGWNNAIENIRHYLQFCLSFQQEPQDRVE